MHIIVPVVTEKANSLREKKIFAFYVSPKANKISLKKEFKELFGVEPLSCKIICGQKAKRKLVMSRSRKAPKKENFKKAYFILDKDIDLSLDPTQGV